MKANGQVMEASHHSPCDQQNPRESPECLATRPFQEDKYFMGKLHLKYLKGPAYRKRDGQWTHE